MGFVPEWTFFETQWTWTNTLIQVSPIQKLLISIPLQHPASLEQTHGLEMALCHWTWPTPANCTRQKILVTLDPKTTKGRPATLTVHLKPRSPEVYDLDSDMA